MTGRSDCTKYRCRCACAGLWGRWLPAAGLGVLLHAALQFPVLAETPGAGWVTVPVSVDSAGVAPLAHPYLDPATLVLTVAPGDTLDASRWLFEPEGPTVRLVPDEGRGWPPFPATLTARYRHLPLDPILPVQHRSPLPPDVADSLRAGQDPVTLPARDPLAPVSRGLGSNLRQSGHLTRGVQVGTGRDVSLESGLRLALDGRLGRGIEVRALLDDRNLPIAPEGTSRRLDEIDQVYMDITADRAAARFGDYRLQGDAGRYGQLDRRLEGGRLRYDGPAVQATAAGAVTRAVFHSNRFSGVDGVQGPYRLTGRDGEQDFLVVGGSETVYVDGIARQRGASADYTIDYARGEITFTPRLPIDSESRIEVDFEYSPEAFPRNLYSGEVAWTDVNDRFRVAALVTQESDDPDRPFGFDMTSSIRNRLAAVGDAPGSVLVPTAEEVEQGAADYVKADTTWTDGVTYAIYRFVEPGPDGEPRGSWRVPFTKVGAGSGDYDRNYDPVLGLYRYTWVGPNQGRYVALRSLPLPERRRHAALAIVAGQGDRVTLAADLGLSDIDRNTLSRIGDDDNAAVAMDVRLQAHPFGMGTGTARPANFAPSQDGVAGLPGPAAAPLAIEARYRAQPGEYVALGRERDVEFDRRYGLDSTDTAYDEVEGELRVVSRPWRPLSLQVGGGYLDRGPNAVARSDAGFSFATPRLDAAALAEHIVQDPFVRMADSNGRTPEDAWTRARGSVTARPWGPLAPGADGEWERRDAVTRDTTWTGFRLARLRVRLAVDEWRGHGGTVYVQSRARDQQVAEERYENAYNESGYGAEWSFARATWRSRVELRHSEKRFATGDSAAVRTDLAAVTAGVRPLNGAVRADLNYQLSRTLTRANALIAYTVPAGQGDYIRVDGEYVYDPEVGDIILRPEPTGDARPTTDLAAALTLEWSPRRLPGNAGGRDGFGWEDISTVIQLEARELSGWEDPAAIAMLDLAAFQTDSTVDGQLTWRQDFHLFRGERAGNLRLRYLADQRLSNLYLTGAERSVRDVWSLLARLALSEVLDSETEARYERLVKDVARRGGTDRFLLRRARQELGWRPNRTWRLSLSVGGLLDRSIVNGEDVRGLSLTPGVIVSLRDRGRITADFETLWVESALDPLPFELADGRPAGRNGRGNLRADYQIGDHLTTRAVYTVRIDSGRDPIHVARVEVSAFF